MTPARQGSEPWMPNGFPPPSFVVETERTRVVGARGRWLAAAAILGALLLIAGVLMIARGDDGKTNLTAGTSTTAVGDTTPTTPTTALDPTATFPTATIDPNAGAGTGTTVAGAATTTVAGAATTAAPPPPAASGELAVASALTIPKVVGTASSSAQMAVKNNGRAALNFNSQTNFSGLTVAPATGSIGAGAEVVVTISLNGQAAAEGPFSGIVSFGGNGGTQRVTVTSSVARLPVLSQNLDAVRQCTPEVKTCNRLIDPLVEGADKNPCNSKWVFKVNVSDESGLNKVQALTPGVVLLRTGVPPAESGPSGIWQSAEQPEIGFGAGKVLTFTIEAYDKFDNVSKTASMTVDCTTATA